jgi:hypothetical protein
MAETMIIAHPHLDLQAQSDPAVAVRNTQSTVRINNNSWVLSAFGQCPLSGITIRARLQMGQESG